MMGISRSVLTAIAVILLSSQLEAFEYDKKMVCYFRSKAVNNPGKGKFDVEYIDPHLCTHLVYSGIGLTPDFKVHVPDPQNDLEENGGRGAMKRFTALKKLNPNLKTMLLFGGHERVAQMASTAAKRRTFINSVIPFLKSQNFDGLDLDWEYPNYKKETPEEKQNFVLLIQELRKEMKAQFLLTAAVACVPWRIDAGYDIPAISRELDFINIMCYDNHDYKENKTGHHSQLGSNPSIDKGYNDRLTSNYSVNHWIAGGAPREKLVLGIGGYGRGFLLKDAGDNGLFASSVGPTPAGPYSKTPGMMHYNEICKRLQNEKWTVVVDEFYETPYAFRGREWIGYDDDESAAAKGQFIYGMGLGGGMIWSMDMDDFRGDCGHRTFPLIRTLRAYMGPAS